MIPSQNRICGSRILAKPRHYLGKRLKTLIKTKLNEDIKIFYQTNKIKDYLKLKDTTPHSIKSQVVYRFSCRKDTEAVYIGHTNRLLCERVREHMSTTTAISEHIDRCTINHQRLFSWQSQHGDEKITERLLVFATIKK